MRRLVAAIALLLAGPLTLTACGSGSSSTDSGSLPTQRIAITIKGDSVTPNGQQYDVALGQRVEFDVNADKPGEIHVHSTPEQEFEYDAGDSTIPMKAIEAPGRVTVESHTLEKTLFILVAR